MTDDIENMRILVSFACGLEGEFDANEALIHAMKCEVCGDD